MGDQVVHQTAGALGGDVTPLTTVVEGLLVQRLLHHRPVDVQVELVGPAPLRCVVCSELGPSGVGDGVVARAEAGEDAGGEVQGPVPTSTAVFGEVVVEGDGGVWIVVGHDVQVAQG